MASMSSARERAVRLLCFSPAGVPLHFRVACSLVVDAPRFGGTPGGSTLVPACALATLRRTFNQHAMHTVLRLA